TWKELLFQSALARKCWHFTASSLWFPRYFMTTQATKSRDCSTAGPWRITSCARTPSAATQLPCSGRTKSAGDWVWGQAPCPHFSYTSGQGQFLRSKRRLVSTCFQGATPE